MNTKLHRLVFNAVRNMLVAVQECATGCVKGHHASTCGGSATIFLPVLWFTTLTAAMMGLPVLAQTLPIQVDKSAPGAHPYVTNAANGTPIVNIAPPNRPGGSSVNNFIQYNVGPSGVVLNNSGGNSQTQIAGWVQGNMQLGNSYAGTIVQQVTAPNPSQILGMQEIAGNRATLVIVNPAGITCSGCGTIGADRFTLSTGRALYGPDGSLAGFDVKQGNIAIDGQGLASPQAQVDLLSRSIAINAQVWADHLNAITGANQIDHQSLTTTPQAGNGSAPVLALDASALGSMYAGAVRLIGTEKGLGFNIGGNVVASTGDILLDNNGEVRIVPSGRLQAQGNASVSGTNVDNAGTVTTRGGISTSTPGQWTNSGVIAAGADLLGMADSIANHGTIGAGVDANANVTGPGTANIAARIAIRSDGTIVSGADSSLSAPNLNLSNGTIVTHGTANLSASGDIQHQNARLEGNTVQVQAGGTLDNRNGSIVAGAGGGTIQGANLLNQGGTATSGADLAVDATQTVHNTGGTIAGIGATSVSGASIINRGGSLGSTQSGLTVQGALDNTAGNALATGDLSVAGGAVTNDQGQMTGKSVSLDAGNQALSNAGGKIQGGTGATSIASASLQNASGSVTSAGTLDVHTPGTVNNQGGTLAANGATTVGATQVNNQGGNIGSAQGSLTIQGPLDNTNGKTLVATDMTLTGGLITNTYGQIVAAQNLYVDIAGQALVNSHGVISGTNVQASTGTINNQAGVVQATGTMAVDTHGQTYDNSQGGLTVANGAMSLNTGALNNAAGTISGQQAVTVTGTTLGNTGGTVVAGGLLALTGDSLANVGGKVASNADATLRITNTLNNTAGFTHAGGTLDVQAGTVINRNTLAGTDTNPLGMEGGTVKVAASSIDNTQGALRADAALTATANSLGNTGGEVTSGGTAQLNVGATTNTNGLLSANQTLGVTGTSLTGDGTVRSQGDVNVKLVSDFNNTQTVTAGKNLTLGTTGDVNNVGTIGAGQALDVHGRNLSNSGDLYSQLSTTLRADQAVSNSGLIDGGAVRIEAGTTVTNLDRIFGDSVSVGAGQEILNDVNPATGNGGVIASRSGDVNLGAPDIVNREHALIYSSQDLNVSGALDASGKVAGQANTLTNASATIDVARDANINVAALSNLNNHFSTTVTDTGTITALTYRLNGSTQDVAASDVIFYQYNNGTWSPGADPSFLGDDDKKVMVLPSARYPFSQFGPPFDWSRTPPPNVPMWFGMQKPIGAAYYPYSYVPDANGDVQFGPEVFVYQPGDAIWSKLGVQSPTAAPPQPVPCDAMAPPACKTQYNADQAAYDTWRAAAKPLYNQLDVKITAFNNDFNGRQVKEWWIYKTNTQIQDEKVASTDPARILVGGNASFGGAVTNDKSQILVGGNLSIPAPVQNLAYNATEIQTVTGTRDWTYIKSHTFSGDDRRYDTYALDPVNINIPKTLEAAVSQSNLGTIGHDGSAPATGPGLAPIPTAPTMVELPLPGKAAGNGAALAANTPGAHLGGDSIRVVTAALAMPRNTLFTVNTQPGAHYLIETDPRFTDQSQWLSSDYLLTQLGQYPDNVLKRLGDGFYEARLVADAVMLGTGQRFVGDYTDNEKQYIGLMNAGVQFEQQYHLNVGSELTAEQMAALTSDIVWLVKRTVTLPDGTTQEVLVPQVYLMTRVGDLKGDGTLIAANNTVIQTTGDMTNTGTIASRNVGLIDANNINNNRGTLNGATLVLNAQQDINNLAGKISGGTVFAQAGRDLNLNSTTSTGSSKTGSNTVLAGVSTIEADNATLLAGRDVNADAASIQTTGKVGIGASGDINLGAVTVAQDEHFGKDAQNNSSLSRSTQIGTQISSGGDTTMVAGRDVNATAASVNADGALGVGAGRDINVNAGQGSASVRDEHHTQSGGILSSKSTHSIDESAGTEALGSTFSGDTVTMNAGRDLTVAGSTVAATHDVNLSATRNLDITTTETQSSAYSFKVEKKSGFGATGNGISYGNRDQKDTTHDSGTQQLGSLVGSTDGSVLLNAGSTLTIKGSDLVARQDITGMGADVNIEAAQNAQHHDETHEVKQSGFTLGVSGGAVGAAVNAANKVESASKSQDGRASALWGMAAGRDAADAGMAVAKDGLTGGAAVTLSFGSSQSKQTLTQDSTNHNGSNVRAGGTAAFVASGVDANGNAMKGDLNIAGSNIDANKVALGAKHNINIVSATDIDASHSTNKSSSASVGVSFGTQGFGVSASASQAKGNSDSQGTTQANSHVTGKESVTFVSGNDTNILGATVGGGKVVGDVGGNLNIASRQDTEEMRAKQGSMGGGFSISQGGGSASFSASRGNASGIYANVGEQSGIYAGQSGFDINVKGNTDLKGAVITSDATKDKNSLTTGTLTFSDIQNHSDYSATSMGVSAGGAMGSPVGQSNSGSTSGKNTGGINPMIPQHKSGNQDGIAHSAIADGTITIRDTANQKQDLADLSRDTAGSNSTVGKGPDLTNILNKQADMMAAAQAAGEALAKTVGDIAKAKLADANKRYAAAAEANKLNPSAENQAAMDAAQADIEGWKNGGSYRAALHTAGGALIAGLGGGNALAGAAGAGAALLAGRKFGELSSAVAGGADTGNAALNETLGNIAANIVASGIGSAVGGGSGAATAANVDRFNRQLHPDEKTLAKKLANMSGGEFTVGQMEDVLRLSGVKNSGVKPDTADTVADVRVPGVLYDGTHMRVEGVSAVETLPAANPDAIAYVQKMTGGSGSPYYWSGASSTSPAASTPIPDPGPQYYSCATTDCLVYGANRNPNNPINKAEDQRQKEMVYAAGTIMAGPLLATPAGQTMLLANGGAGLIGGAVNAGAQGLTNGWSSINYFDVGVATVTGYYGAASQAALIGRYGTGWLGQTSSLITATSINTIGAAGSNYIKSESNANLPGAIVGTIGAYPTGYYFGSKSPAIGAFAGSAIQETVNWGIGKMTPSTQQPIK